MATPSELGDAGRVALLVALDPVRLGGVVLRAAPGPRRDAWLARLVALCPGQPVRRLPLHVDDTRLLGGLDLAATLQAGRAVAARGLLAAADGGLVVVAMAERMTAGTAAHLAAALDAAGSGGGAPRFGTVVLDEGLGDDEAAPARLAERLAFRLTLDTAPDGVAGIDAAELDAARELLPTVTAADEIVEALCAAALALGIDSARGPWLALRAAHALAALAGRRAVDAADAALAARLVLAHRATRLPADESPAPPPDAVPPVDPNDAPPPSTDAADPDPADVVLQAALAALPPHLLDAARKPNGPAAHRAAAGRAGAARRQALRGRPLGARRGVPRGGARLALLETLRAAAPWQRLRRREAAPGPGPAVLVRRDDVHVRRFADRSETTTLFVVDASGSSALHRLAEAKGAVELLLADCYVRRDSVALIAFRGRAAELLLPPTRSLVRAKRSLAGLPGGGGTPLAAGLDAAARLVDTLRRRGTTPVVVLLTDGRGNVARDGSAGREAAVRDALAAAAGLRETGAATIVIDTSPQPQEAARRLAAALAARYVPLPHAGAGVVSRVVRAVT